MIPTSRPSFAELGFHAYRLVISVVTMAFCIHVLCEYSWSLSAFYAVCTVVSYCAGQGIVGFLQQHRATREAVGRDTDPLGKY